MLHLSNGADIKCDALLLGTGWRSSLTYLSEELKAELGLPHDPSLEDTATRAKWSAMHEEVDKDVLRKFPLLGDPPPHTLKAVDTSPFRPYRGIAPTNDPSRSIVFVNFLLS